MKYPADAYKLERRLLKPHGTNAAYRRHYRHGETPCKPCRQAERVRDRAARAPTPIPCGCGCGQMTAGYGPYLRGHHTRRPRRTGAPPPPLPWSRQQAEASTRALMAIDTEVPAGPPRCDACRYLLTWCCCPGGPRGGAPC